jgi:hypothetical protein
MRAACPERRGLSPHLPLRSALSEFHRTAAAKVRGLAEGRTPWALPWPCLHEFFSIVTHPRIYDPPSRVDQALEQIDAWLETTSAVVLARDIAPA